LIFGVGQLAPEYLERCERAFLVLAHQPRIARDIGRQDRRQPALDPFALRGIHRGSLPSGAILQQALSWRQRDRLYGVRPPRHISIHTF
jgi:hypothetical protein